MTEQGRCETCKYGEVSERTPRWIMCGKVIAGICAIGVDHSVSVLSDFGCIYHEVRPEKHCRTCYWRSDSEEPRPGCSHPSEVWHLCIKRSKTGERIAVRGINVCDQWEERHG